MSPLQLWAMSLGMPQTSKQASIKMIERELRAARNTCSLMEQQQHRAEEEEVSKYTKKEKNKITLDDRVRLTNKVSGMKVEGTVDDRNEETTLKWLDVQFDGAPQIHNFHADDWDIEHVPASLDGFYTSQATIWRVKGTSITETGIDFFHNQRVNAATLSMQALVEFVENGKMVKIATLDGKPVAA